MTKPVGFTDLYLVQEDERIRLIGEKAMTQVVGVQIDADRKKVARYILKVTKRYPTVKHMGTERSRIPKVVTVVFGPKGH